MKEALFILLVFAVILVLTAIRYRHQIAGVLRIWRSLKAMKQQMSQRSAEVEDKDKFAGPLVNCAKCGTWVPEQKSIKLGGATVYCSTACLESIPSSGTRF
jgi:ribosomal protein S26